MNSTVILVFTHARPSHTKNLLDSLRQCDGFCNYKVIIYSDGAKTAAQMPSVEQNRSFLNIFASQNSNVEIVYQENNRGLAVSVITGVTATLKEHEAVIVLEDDLVLSNEFLSYMQCSLNEYRMNFKVWSVTGYSFPFITHGEAAYDNYALPRAMSWGWATWRDRWDNVDWDLTDYDELMCSKVRRESFSRGGQDLIRMMRLYKAGRISSWAIRWCYEHFKRNAFCMYSSRPLVKNEGFDGSGVHCRATTRFDVEFEKKGRYDKGWCLMTDISVRDSDLVLLQKNHRLGFVRRVLSVFGI